MVLWYYFGCVLQMVLLWLCIRFWMVLLWLYITMVLKTGPGREPEKGVVPVSLVRLVVEPVTL